MTHTAGRFLGRMALTNATPLDSASGRLRADAIAVLIQLGEARPVALALVERVLTADPTIDSADDLITSSLRLKDLG